MLGTAYQAPLELMLPEGNPRVVFRSGEIFVLCFEDTEAWPPSSSR